MMVGMSESSNPHPTPKPSAAKKATPSTKGVQQDALGAVKAAAEAPASLLGMAREHRIGSGKAIDGILEASASYEAGVDASIAVVNARLAKDDLTAAERQEALADRNYLLSLQAGEAHAKQEHIRGIRVDDGLMVGSLAVLAVVGGAYLVAGPDAAKGVSSLVSKVAKTTSRAITS